MENKEKDFNDLFALFQQAKFRTRLVIRIVMLKNLFKRSFQLPVIDQQKETLKQDANELLNTLLVNYEIKYEKPVPWEDLDENDLEYLAEGNIHSKEDYEDSRPVICSISNNDSKKAFSDMIKKRKVNWFFENDCISDEYLLAQWNEYLKDSNLNDRSAV